MRIWIICFLRLRFKINNFHIIPYEMLYYLPRIIRYMYALTYTLIYFIFSMKNRKVIISDPVKYATFSVFFFHARIA